MPATEQPGEQLLKVAVDFGKRRPQALPAFPIQFRDSPPQLRHRLLKVAPLALQFADLFAKLGLLRVGAKVDRPHQLSFAAQPLKPLLFCGDIHVRRRKRPDDLRQGLGLHVKTFDDAARNDRHGRFRLSPLGFGPYTLFAGLPQLAFGRAQRSVCFCQVRFCRSISIGRLTTVCFSRLQAIEQGVPLLGQRCGQGFETRQLRLSLLKRFLPLGYLRLGGRQTPFP